MVKRKQMEGAFQMKFIGFLQSVYSNLFLLLGKKRERGKEEFVTRAAWFALDALLGCASSVSEM